MLGTYSVVFGFCVERSHLVMLREPYAILELETGLMAYKASTLTPVLALPPLK